jgi:phage terminase large subunit
MSTDDRAGVGDSGGGGFGAGTRAYLFEPLEWQSGFLESTASEILGSGAFGSGKSRAVTEKAYLLSILYPGNRGLLARKTHSSLKETTLEVLLDETLPENQVVDHHQSRHRIEIRSPLYPRHYCANPGCEFETSEPIRNRLGKDVTEIDGPIRVPCQACDELTLATVPTSVLYYKGLNTIGSTQRGGGNVASMNLGHVGVDEVIELTKGEWLMLAGRLRLESLSNPYVPKLPLRQIYAATNPDDPTHWLYKRFYNEGVGDVFEGETEDNIHNPDDYAPTLKDQFSGTDADRFLRGQWVGYEGRVYDEFSIATHIINPLDVADLLGDGWQVTNFETLASRQRAYSSPTGDAEAAPDADPGYEPARVIPPEGTPIVISIDWGYRPDPTCVQWWARTPTHGYVLYRELMRTRTLPDEIAGEALHRMAPHEYEQVERVYADHDSGERADWKEGVRGYAANLREEGTDETEIPDPLYFRTTAARKDVSDGIREVKRRLRVDENGRAEVHLIRGARAHQADRHLRTDDKPPDTLTEIQGYSWQDDGDEPVKEDDHGVDAMRYALFSEKKLGRAGAGQGQYETSVHKS